MNDDGRTDGVGSTAASRERNENGGNCVEGEIGDNTIEGLSLALEQTAAKTLWNRPDFRRLFVVPTAKNNAIQR